jgi:hypothetical protein
MADPPAVAEALGTNAIWVERCLRTYGRRLKNSRMENGGTTEQHLESFEEGAVKAIAPEEVGEEGATAPPTLQERQRHKPPVVRKRKTPSDNQEPSEDNEEQSE